MKTVALWLIGSGLWVFAAGCNKTAEGAPAGATSGAAASAQPAPSAAATAAPAPVAVQPAKAKVNGKSLSTASMSDIGDALKKEGYAYKSGGGMSMGSTETVTVRGSKGKEEVKVSLIRPTGKPDTGGSMKMSKAADQEASFAKDGATYLEKDAEVLVAVVIEGKKDEAKKILDAIIEK